MNAESDDPMRPRSDATSALCSPLRILTITSGDLQATRRFYQGALGLVPETFVPDDDWAAALIEHWGLLPSRPLRIDVFRRPGLDDAFELRVIEVPGALPVMRPHYIGEYIGALGLGFPSDDLEVRDRIVRALGFDSTAGITRMDFSRADGTTYNVGEVHYRAPDEVLVLGVDRGGMTPVSRIDPALGIGGPAYASMIISDVARVAPAFAEVLGYEMRREMTFESGGPSGGMGLQKGARVVFQQWFSPGASAGYLVIMKLLDVDRPAPVPLGPTARGVAMWSFETADVEAAAARAEALGLEIRSAPRAIGLPGIGPAHSLVIATADGFPIEIYARTGAG
jgi:catechol 2,3-dioxygenase-like lactoylglutathione lyase family enzyme